jgi:hypothetical protein
VANTGNTFPTVGATVDRAGATAWTSPGNVVSDNASNASAVVPTDYLVTSGYGFSSTVPANVAIRGVIVRIEASETGSGSSNYIPQLHSATTPTLIGSAKGAITITTGPTVSTSGDVTDLWGTTLTAAQVRDAGFGVSIWSTDTINTLSIDYVTIDVIWTDVPNAWDAREYFRKRRNLTNRKLRELLPTETTVVPEDETSADRALEAPFRTVTLRSRRSLSVGWIAAFAPAAVVTPPVSAWLAPMALRRKATERRLLVVDDTAIERYTPPSIAWSDPPKVVRVEFRRTLQVLAAQVELPPTAAPPTAQGFPAWTTEQLPATFQDRRLQSVLDAPFYPETPAEEVSDDRAIEASFVTRHIRSRKALRLPFVPVSAAPPGTSEAVLPALFSPRTKKRRSRQGLFLSGGGIVEARVQPQYPSYATAQPKKRRSLERRLLRGPGLPSAPVTPAVEAQPVTSWQAPKQHRIERDRTLQEAAPQITYPQTPAVAAQPESAWRAPRSNWIERERKLQPAAPQITYPVTPVHPIASTPRVDAIRRAETERTLRVAEHGPSYPATPAPPQAPTAFRLAESFRRHGWRRQRFVLEIDTYPETPEQSKPTLKKTLRLGAVNRTERPKRKANTVKAEKPKRTEH